jgi:hypothetical protein
MYTIEYAYELADQYTAITGGYTCIRIDRWNFNTEEHKSPQIEYALTGQDLIQQHYKTIDALVERLKELLA